MLEKRIFKIFWTACEIKPPSGDFYIDSGFLFKGNRLCVPITSLREYLIQEYHAYKLTWGVKKLT